MNPEIKVDALKLSRGLRTTFEGIALIFDSIGADVELLTQVPAKKTSSPASSAQTVKEPKPEPKPEPEPEPEQPQTEAAPSSLTLDDITKVIVSKVKQNQAASDAIGKLVQSFGVATVKQIPVEKYEEFMTKLAAL